MYIDTGKRQALSCNLQDIFRKEQISYAIIPIKIYLPVWQIQHGLNPFFSDNKSQSTYYLVCSNISHFLPD